MLLRKVGHYFYGYSSWTPGAVTRLPFNLYLKNGNVGHVHRGTDTSHANQARAMDLVERHTQIPAPRTIDVISTPKLSFLLMTRAPGTPLGHLLIYMSDAEIAQLVQDLRRCLWQMVAIPNPFSPQWAICSAHGEGCFDFRLNGSTRVDNIRFKSEAEFNEFLLSEVPESEREQATRTLSIIHRIYFTHGDLNMRNILIDKGKLSGIVDWENAGWLPEYWDYTKIHFTTRLTRRFLDDVVEKVFPDYSKELENERSLWQWVR